MPLALPDIKEDFELDTLLELCDLAESGKLDDSKENRDLLEEATFSGIAVLRDRWLRDINTFASECLGYIIEPFHAEWLEMVYNEDAIAQGGEFCVGSVRPKRRGILAPRGFGKSTIRTTVRNVWLILRNLDYRILITSETAGSAKQFLQEIKEIFEFHVVLRLVFGDYTGGFNGNSTVAGNTWTDSKIECVRAEPDGRGGVEYIRRGISAKEPTINTMGVLGAGTGLHYDEIDCDDIIVMKNSRTKGMRDTIRDWVNNTLAPMLMKPHGNWYFNGTRYHPDDLYKHWSGKDGEFEGEITLYKAINTRVPDLTGIAEDSGGHREEEEYSLWEVMFPIEDLRQMRRRRGPAAFNAQMQNDCEAMLGAIVKPDWINVINLDQFDEKSPNLIWVGASDPKWQREDYEKGAAAGYIRMAINPETWNIYIWLARKWYPDFKEYTGFLKDEALFMHKRGTPFMALFFEQNALQNCIETDIKFDDHLGIVPLQGITTVTDKVSRFIAKQGMFYRGQIYLHPVLMEGEESLFEDLIGFPHIERLDLVDTLMLGIEGLQTFYVYTEKFAEEMAPIKHELKKKGKTDEEHQPLDLFRTVPTSYDLFEAVMGKTRSVI